tara:strand:- start:12694 stop:13257 length:564 start_codon:yes stop_codon:yes gene_type:complete
MLLVIDNYDSFTYNLVQYFEMLGQEVHVHRNDKLSLKDIEKKLPDYLVISPGPCTPSEAGISVDAINFFKGKVPILGVCLGHQCIGVAFGAQIIRAQELMHGKVSKIFHDSSGIFKDLKQGFEATRYHSLVIDESTLAEELTINARTEDKTIMSISHKEYPLFGLQFHPESLLTESGIQILENYLSI